VFPDAVQDRHRLKLSDSFVPAGTLLREASLGMMLTPNSLKSPADYSKNIAKDTQTDRQTDSWA
jgi:hypothetical protein